MAGMDPPSAATQVALRRASQCSRTPQRCNWRSARVKTRNSPYFNTWPGNMLCCCGSSHVLLSCRTDRKPSSERVEKGSSVELQCKYGVIVSSDKISHVITNSTVPATRLSSRSCHDSWGECRKYLSPTFLLGVLFSDGQAGAPVGIPNGACLVDPDSLI